MSYKNPIDFHSLRIIFQDKKIRIQKLGILMKTSDVFFVLRDDLPGFEHCFAITMSQSNTTIQQFDS